MLLLVGILAPQDTAQGLDLQIDPPFPPSGESVAASAFQVRGWATANIAVVNEVSFSGTDIFWGIRGVEPFIGQPAIIDLAESVALGSLGAGRYTLIANPLLDASRLGSGVFPIDSATLEFTVPEPEPALLLLPLIWMSLWRPARPLARALARSGMVHSRRGR